MVDGQRPQLPDGVRIYAVGDIHGRADLLSELFGRIDGDRAEHAAERTIEIYLGDYIDRGPASREVVDLLIDRAGRREVVCLKGNHEDIALQFLNEPRLFSTWAQIGGRETLMSYGLNPIVRRPDEMAALARAFGANLPQGHRSFLSALPVFYVGGDFMFVHAGVKPGVPLDRQREADLLWIREEFLTWDAPFGKVIVHGHTPVLEPEFHGNRINIDTGAYATGRLSCVCIEADALRLI